MTIIPAIDLQAGRCVRLFKGRFDKVTTYSDDPIALAQQYEAQGATELHIVDLEGARLGQPQAAKLIAQIKSATQLKIQTGGGIRTQTAVESLLEKGIDRVVMGSLAINQPSLIKSWMRQFGSERFVLALDVRLDDVGEPWLVTQGWQQVTTLSLWSLLTEYSVFNDLAVLCTDIDRDGVLSGPNLDLYRQCLQRFSNVDWQASGGVSQLNDLKALSSLGLKAAIVGKALYEKHFTLTAAIEETLVC